MKFNFKNIVVPALAIVAGASLAGSVAGSVAWYQYTTRTTAAYVGTAVSATRNLQIKVGSGDYKTDLTNKDIATYLSGSSQTDTLAPVTTGGLAKDAALPATLYGNPVYQYENYSNFQAAPAGAIVTLPLTLKVMHNGAAQQNQKIYLADLEIAESGSGTTGIDSALRVHLAAGTTYMLFAKGASAGDVSTTTHGALDLDGDGHNDKVEGFIYDADSPDARPDCDYGKDTTGPQVAYNTIDAANFVDDSTPVLSGTAGLLGTTNSSGELSVTATIFLEGWTKLGSPANAIWDSSTVGAAFQVGLRFACNAQIDS